MIRSIIWSKRQWLETYDHGRHKRPEHEVMLKRRELTVLDDIAADYQRHQHTRGSRARVSEREGDSSEAEDVTKAYAIGDLHGRSDLREMALPLQL